MLTVIGDAPSRSGRMSVVQCSCGHTWEAPTRRVPFMRSCGCAMKRRPRVKVEMVTVPRFVPASHWRTDTAVIGALLIALRLPFDELSFLAPIDADLLRELAGLDADDLDRAALRRWLESDGTRVYGVRCSASLVFGSEQTACDGGRGKVAA